MSEEEIAKLAKAWDERFRSLEEEVRGKSQTGDESGAGTKKSTGRNEVPLYKCKGEGCTFSTDDISALMLHTVEEHSPKPAEPPKPRHRTIDEARGFLACPECRKSFVQAAKEDPKFLEEIKPPEEERSPEKKKRGFSF